jgi:hypothetical protein
MTKGQRAFIFGWSALLILTSASLFFLLTSQQIQRRQAAAARHAARMTQDEGCPKAAAGQAPADVVNVGVYVDRVPEVSFVTSGWKADFFVWFSWDGDLPDPGNSFRLVNGELLSRTLTRKVDNGRHHYTRYKVSAQITKNFDVARFPLDEHLLTIQIEDQALLAHQLCYVADPRASSISSRVEVPGYKIAGTSISVKSHAYKTSLGDPDLSQDFQAVHSDFLFGIEIARGNWGMFIKMFIALYIAVALALFGLLLRGPAERLALGGSALFVAIGNATSITPLIPYTGTTTLADVIGGLGYLFIGFVLVQAILYHKYFADPDERQEVSLVFDVTSVVILSVAYVALNVGVLASAMG